MTITSPSSTLSSRGSLGCPMMLNHLAYVTHDIGETAKFYTEVLGMTIANSVMDDRIPSTGEAFPYFHLFFRMGDGSTLAFFESPGLPPPRPPSHPAYRIFDHVAFLVPSEEAIYAWKEWLESNSVTLLGPIDHRPDAPFVSIYFRDPVNDDIRLELTTPLSDDWNDNTDHAMDQLEKWLAAKERATREDRDMTAELCELIAAVKHGADSSR